MHLQGAGSVAGGGVLRLCGPSAISAASPDGSTARAVLGEWSNGNTAVFGTVILGSSPSPPARPMLRAWPAAYSIGFSDGLPAGGASLS